MKKLILLLILLIPSIANALFPIPLDKSWDDTTGLTVFYGADKVTIDNTDYAPTSPSKSLRFTYPALWGDGNAPAQVQGSFSSDLSEIWFEHYFKYSSNWDQHENTDKQVYVTLADGRPSGYGEFFILNRQASGTPRLVWCWQSNAPNLQSFVLYANQSSSNFTLGAWHKVTVHVILNTPGVADGTVEMWLDDVKTHNYQSNQMMRASDVPSNIYFHSVDYAPVWGGNSGDVKHNETDYFWIDRTRIQTTPFGASGDQSAPYASQWSPAKSATGVAVTNRAIQFHVQDDTAVTTSGTVTIEGTPYTCGSGITCTGLNTNNMTITYTKGSDWTPDQVVNVSTTGFADAAGNVMTTDTWSYTIESAAQGSPTITTPSPLTTRTQGASFSETFTATGGTSPYTWSVIAGSLPPGTTLSSGGVFSGTPSATGPYNFTVKIVDAVAAEDNQALAIIVNPATPGGQSTVNVTAIQDTYIWPAGGANGDNNVSSSAQIKVYQWPAYSWANRILDNVPISLPDNVSIVSARLYMYGSSHEGSGGTDPMRVYAYRVSDNVPTISTVTGNNFTGTLQPYESVTEVPLAPGWASWNVREMVAWAYANGSPLYIALDGGQDGATDTNRIFTSVEGAEGYRPYLSITYMQQTSGGVSINAPGKMRAHKFRGRFR